MAVLYDRLLDLCNDRGITGYRMAKDAGVSVNLMTDLKSGRKKGLSAEVANKLAAYFGVSVGYLLGTEELNISVDDLMGTKKESPAAQMSSGVDKEILDIVRSLDADQKETALAVLQALVRKKGK